MSSWHAVDIGSSWEEVCIAVGAGEVLQWYNAIMAVAVGVVNLEKTTICDHDQIEKTVDDFDYDVELDFDVYFAEVDFVADFVVGCREVVGGEIHIGNP